MGTSLDAVIRPKPRRGMSVVGETAESKGKEPFRLVQLIKIIIIGFTIHDL